MNEPDDPDDADRVLLKPVSSFCIRAAAVEHIGTPCDLTESSVSHAIWTLGKRRDIARILLAPHAEAALAIRLADLFRLELVLLPQPMVGEHGDSWAVAGYRSVIWSPGA